MNLNQFFLKTCILTAFVSTSLVAYSNPSTAQEQGCVTTDKGVTVCGQLKPTEDPSSNPEYRKEINDFIVSFQGCKRYSDIALVKCKFQIDNQGKERTISLGLNESSLVDSSGISYSGFSVEIGGKKYTDSNWSVISPGINYVTFMTFKDFPQKITQVPLLNFYFGNGSDGGGCCNWYKLQYRNIIIASSSGSRPSSTSKPPQSSKGSNSGKYGTLVAQDSQARVNVRDEPRLDAYNRHYGLVGDRVLVLGSTKSQDGYTWYKVKFQISGAQGWIRGDFVSVSN